MTYYILKGHETVPVYDVLEWARAFETMDRRVAEDHVGESRISTMFLGIDHSFRPGGPPLVFETMVFGGTMDDWQERYCTWNQAVEGHRAIVEKIRAWDKAEGD
jgi:hypothetical protein